MSITNKIFLDSSFFVEGYKGRHQEFYNYIVELQTLECCINDIVCSEYWYHLFGMIGGKSPLSLKESNNLSTLADQHHERFSFFEHYSMLHSTLEAIRFSLQAVRKYNLLSNDALILGTCMAYQIPFLASHDTGFREACAGEGIRLITTENYRTILPN